MNKFLEIFNSILKWKMKLVEDVGKFLFKNPLVKNILSAVAVAVVGFVLLNLTFLFYVFLQNLIQEIFGYDISFQPKLPWLAPLLFLLIIGLISWLVFRSKLNAFWKASVAIIPLAVILVFIGIRWYIWPVIAYSFGGLLSLGVLYYLWRAKKSWLYFYVVILVSAALAISSLLGMEI